MKRGWTARWRTQHWRHSSRSSNQVHMPSAALSCCSPYHLHLLASSDFHVGCLRQGPQRDPFLNWPYHCSNYSPRVSPFILLTYSLWSPNVVIPTIWLQMTFISALLKSEELAASDHCNMPVRCLSESLKKIIFLSLLLRESWKSILTRKRNSGVSNKTVFITEQLKGEWHS